MKNLSIITAAAVALGLATSTASAAFVEIGKSGDGITNQSVVPAADQRYNKISTSTRLTRDNVYILTRVIFVEPSVTLTIEPGTIIRGVIAGASGSDLANEPGALVVARGAKVVANGTPDDPIVFTSIDDPHVIGGTSTIPGTYVNAIGNTKNVTALNYAPDGPGGTYTADPDGAGPLLSSTIPGNNGFAQTGQCGGLIILGSGYTANYNTGAGTPPTAAANDNNSDGLPDSLVIGNPTNTNTLGFGNDIIEGLNVGTIASADVLGEYGGTNDANSSGVFRFVSVRYGGFKIGTNNEINAITCGGIGTGTILEFCEAAFNIDDGFEFFGGKVNSRHLYSLYNMDDSFDADEGFRGDQQFWAVIQANLQTARSGYLNNLTPPYPKISDTEFDKLFEVDGAENDNLDAIPYTKFNVYNLSLLSGGTTNNSVRFRLEAQVGLYNTAADRMARVASDSPQLNTAAGDGTIKTIGQVFNFHYFNNGNTADADSVERRAFTHAVDVALNTTATEESVKQFAGSNLAYGKNGVDLRLGSGVSALVEDGALPPAGLVQTNYAGYMRDNQFLSGWSLLDYLEVLAPTNIVRPALSITGTTNPVITFASAGSAVKYVIEKSTDRKTWTPVNTGTPVSDPSTVSFTDISTTLTSATPVYYRAYAL